MEWLTVIRKSIEYIENHLEENISVNDVGKSVYTSSIFLQKGFSLMTGYSINEYIRNRRLYEAAIDLCTKDDKIIDIAYKYCYETPESFTKAFTRFHNATPTQIRLKEASIKTFLPLQINISIVGGEKVEYKIKKLSGFKVIGFSKDFSFEKANELIPKFWDEVEEKYVKKIIDWNNPTTKASKAIINNHVGEFGICVDDNEKGVIKYLIAGSYEGGEIPEEMEIYEFKDSDYAIFDCYGPMPDAIQEMSNKIFKEWLPGNPDYEINGNASIEWYDENNKNKEDAKYHTQIWLPVIIKKN